MRHLKGFDSEQGHGYVSRPLTRTEMQFFSYTLDEREAIALAQVCTLPENATYAEIEDAVLKCFTIALEHAGLKDSIEYVGGQRRDTLRIVQ
jgi:hypothetical protein